ncbi:NAD(P)-binding protein [Streptomyces sp. B1866]|uniref:NAD(P)-binding protein n=1 Tax=Streptomyces sp. B1866 TaxID=3075431 RepID=UPI0028927596|nr:NAD(P)-binding protein [Streptomyces sp. B1866]MDT3397733.1 NAD(P)-binding protein [Streptomyces sp. B1866]
MNENTTATTRAGAVVTVVGGGLAGLTAAIAAAERGAPVVLHEAHATLGGRARTTPAPYRAGDGPHAFYSDGAPWRWLAARGLHRPYARPGLGALAGLRFLHQGRLRRVPPGALRPALSRRLAAPVDRAFGDWAGERFGPEATAALCGLVGVATYEADPGRLSAAFVWERVLRLTRPGYPAARYLVGGWGPLVDRMAARAQELGVRVATGSHVDSLDSLPPGPVVVATSLAAARRLLGDDGLRGESGRAVLMDVGLRRARGDLFLVSDLDGGGFVERYSLPDPTVAPAGHSLVQTEVPLRREEPKSAGLARAERLLDLAAPGWRERVAWSRTSLSAGRTGALDLPGTTWRDRPPVGYAEGIYLAGDEVAAPGLLSEVAVNSALRAAGLAAAELGGTAAGRALRAAR